MAFDRDPRRVWAAADAIRERHLERGEVVSSKSTQVSSKPGSKTAPEPRASLTTMADNDDSDVEMDGVDMEADDAVQEE